VSGGRAAAGHSAGSQVVVCYSMVSAVSASVSAMGRVLLWPCRDLVTLVSGPVSGAPSWAVATGRACPKVTLA
jgi:hypothetical protein